MSIQKPFGRFFDLIEITPSSRSRPPLLGGIACPILVVALLFGHLAVRPSCVAAQQPNAVKPADTSSPRATLKSFIESCNEFGRIIRTEKHLDRTSPKHRPLARRILDCLDVREIPGFARGSRAGRETLRVPPEPRRTRLARFRRTRSRTARYESLKNLTLGPP